MIRQVLTTLMVMLTAYMMVCIFLGFPFFILREMLASVYPIPEVWLFYLAIPAFMVVWWNYNFRSR